MHEHRYADDEQYRAFPAAWRELSESALARRVADGSTIGLGMVYARHGNTLYRIARRMLTTSADAEDVVHDVFLGLPRAIRTFDGTGTLEGWLKRVTIRAVLMRMRHQRSQDDLWAKLKTHWTSDVACRPLTDRISFHDALATLPPVWRAVTSLKLEGYSHAEIGEMLELTEAASKQQFYRATKRLRELLAT
jgi:RNA polymerase sigma-70 factor, ECF subfamily